MVGDGGAGAAAADVDSDEVDTLLDTLAPRHPPQDQARPPSIVSQVHFRIRIRNPHPGRPWGDE